MPRLQFGSAIVTGGAGFIGSHICEELVRQGARTICLDNFVAGKMENIAHLVGYPNFSVARADVSQAEEIEPYFKDIQVVFHNAASKNTVCRDDPHLDLSVNAWGTWCVADAARRHGAKVIHASTGSVYGELTSRPQTEDHRLAPRSFYGTSKLAGETYLRAFASYYPGEFRYSVVRYFHVYGPRQESSDSGGVIPIFIRRALSGKNLVIFGDGSQIRSFTYVTDDVEANIVLANEAAADGEAYNAAASVKVTVLELAQRILELMGRQDLEIEFADWRPGDIRDFDVDNSKLARLGATFSTSFEDGLRATIDWYCHYLTPV